MRKEIEVLVRAVIQNKGKTLVCKRVDKKYYFFPGGHVKFGESTGKALARELKEELGLKIKKASFIGGSEHLFIEGGIKRHEINLAFDTLVKKINTKSREEHLEFLFLDKNSLAKEKVLPLVLVRAILKWFKDKKIFWLAKNEKRK